MVDTALRLAKYFVMSPEFWMGLQNDYDVETTLDNKEERLGLARFAANKGMTGIIFEHDEYFEYPVGKGSWK
jgi:plasmid maintenance system antidote protein VapI